MVAPIGIVNKKVAVKRSFHLLHYCLVLVLDKDSGGQEGLAIGVLLQHNEDAVG
jgi:hypothetical protein